MSSERVDVAAYGHITYDTIYEDFEEKNTLGALANFWSGIINGEDDVSVRLVPCAIGKAIILVDKSTAIRVGRGNLNIKKNEAKPIPSKWHHIMYLNQLPETDFIEKIKEGFISADITSGPPPSFDLLSKLDYLFISDEDLFMPVEELALLVKGWVIMHHAAGSFCSNGKESFEIQTDIIQNINVLGAGDMFAASFISKKINTDLGVEDCVKHAHNQTTKLLLKENNL